MIMQKPHQTTARTRALQERGVSAIIEYVLKVRYEFVVELVLIVKLSLSFYGTMNSNHRILLANSVS